MDEHEDLIQRLRDVGRQPIDATVRSAHLTAMEHRPVPLLRSKVRVAAAFLAGLLVGGSGLAAAGALPDPAQNVAHNVFEKVGVQVPQPERYHGEECGPEKSNHGQYVKADKARAKGDCGKPLKATDGGNGEQGSKAPGERGKSQADRGPCTGPPPWAADKSMTEGQKAAAQAEREAACPDDDVAEAGDADVEPDEAPATEVAQPTTTTTALATTTTTMAEEPTTTTTA